MPIYQGNTKIVKLYKGTTEIVRRYKGTNLIYQNSLLPAGYIACEYLESTGTQYIDTGFTPTNTTKVDVDVALLGFSGTSSVSRWCCVLNSGSPRYGLFFGYDQSQSFAATIQLGWGSVYKNILYTFSEQTRFNAVVENASVYVNGDLIDSATANTFTAGSTLQIFRSKSGESARVYKCKIYDNGTLVRDLIPCLDTNGAPCMYDVITKQTYYNAGTGTFYFAVGGKLPTGYKHIKYIQSWNDGSSITSPPRPRIEIPFEYKDTMTLRWIEASDSQANNLAIYSGTTRMAFLNGWTSSGKITARYDQTSVPSSVTPSAGQIYDLRLASDGFYVDGIKQGDAVSVDYPNDTVIVNCLKSGGYYASISRNYLIQIIDQNGNILLNAVPCLDDNDVPCMYDTISQTTITKTPSNAGNFLYEE